MVVAAGFGERKKIVAVGFRLICSQSRNFLQAPANRFINLANRSLGYQLLAQIDARSGIHTG